MNIKFLGLVFFILIFIIEKLRPYFKFENIYKYHDLNNILAGLVNGIISYIFFLQANLWILKYIAERNIGIFNIYNLGVFRLFLALIVLDLWLYFWHRSNHKIAFLRKFHMAHHTDRNMNISTALRFHPIELIFSFIIKIPVFFIFGFRFKEVLIYEILLNLMIYFHHSNIKINDRFDKFIRIMVVSPNMHKNHHSVKLKETDSNYSSILSIWDRIFGTYTVYKKKENFKYGIPNYRDKKWQNYFFILLTPFKYRSKNGGGDIDV